MTTHKREKGYRVVKKKKLTNKEKQERAACKKRMQEQGILPPDKPKLNRKKFIEEAQAEWNDRDTECCMWNVYLIQAMSYMLGQVEKGGRVSPEAVGVAKVLKLAMRLREFSEELKAKGKHEYKVVDQYNYIKDMPRKEQT